MPKELDKTAPRVTLLELSKKLIDENFVPRGSSVEKNLYKDSEIPFMGKRAIMSQRPVPSDYRVFDITAVAHWMRNLATNLGILDTLSLIPGVDVVPGPPSRSMDIASRIAKGAHFVGTQVLLASLNPAGAEGLPGGTTWNPLSLGAAIPGLRGVSFTNFTIGATATTRGNAVKAQAQVGLDKLTLMRKGLYVETRPVEQLMQGRMPMKGYRGPLTKDGPSPTLSTKTTSMYSISDQLDGGPITEGARKTGGLHTNIYTPEERYSDKPILPLAKLEERRAKVGPDVTGLDKILEAFEPKKFPGGPPISVTEAMTWLARPITVQERGWQSLRDAPGDPARNISTAISVHLNEKDKQEGILKEKIEEGAIYMPFMFQDLRNKVPEYLYFRAFLKSGLAETFTPDWHVERFYGRVDQIPIYMGTIRNLALAFDVVAWTPEDLIIMWKKLEKLQSMVYPFYDKGGFYKAGPIVRMRIGDLFAGSNKLGLPGYITSMDWSYDDGIWNITPDYKVPRKISITLNFTVIHDGNPGTYPYRNADLFPAGGEPKVNTAGVAFGAGKFTKSDNTESKGVNIQVSPTEIRKIFDSVLLPGK